MDIKDLIQSRLLFIVAILSAIMLLLPAEFSHAQPSETLRRGELGQPVTPNDFQPGRLETAQSFSRQARIQIKLGDRGGALKSLRQALQIYESAFGADQSYIATALTELGDLQITRGKLIEAEQLYRRALEIHKDVFGDSSFMAAIAHERLARLYRDQGRFDAAERQYQVLLEIYDNIFDLGSHMAAQTLNSLAQLSVLQGHRAEAQSLLGRCLKFAPERCKPLGPADELGTSRQTSDDRISPMLWNCEFNIFSVIAGVVLTLIGIFYLADISKNYRSEAVKFLSSLFPIMGRRANDKSKGYFESIIELNVVTKFENHNNIRKFYQYEQISTLYPIVGVPISLVILFYGYAFLVSACI